MWDSSCIRQIFFDQDKEMFMLGKVRFLFRGGGGVGEPGLRGESLVNFYKLGRV